MNDEAFMAYLKTHHPYLYYIEIEIRKTVDKFGYGDLSSVIKIQHNKAQYIEFINQGRIKFDNNDG